MSLICCLLIVIISTAIGRLFAARMGDRLILIREYQTEYTRLAENMIGLRVEIIKALQNGAGGRIDAIFKNCAAELLENPQRPLRKIWRTHIAQLKDAGLTKDDLRIVMEGGEAAEAICVNPSEKQALIYLNRLSAYAAEMEREKTKKSKLYNTAGVLTGLLIALLVV